MQALLPILKAKRRAFHHYARAESWQVQLKGDIKCKLQPETTEVIYSANISRMSNKNILFYLIHTYVIVVLSQIYVNAVQTKHIYTHIFLVIEIERYMKQDVIS